MILKQRVGFIGAGQMATALGQGFIQAGLVASEQVCAADPVAESRKQFAQITGAAVFPENAPVWDAADIVFLAVKPQQIGATTAQAAGKLRKDQLVVSVAAGVRIVTLQDALGDGVRLVRVMPNTPCLVAKGACGFCLGKAATAADGQVVAQLLGAVGAAYEVEEKLLDAVTGLSGSGPAFIYVVIEALSDAGVRMGLPRNVATSLAAQTVSGAAQMVLDTGEHTAVLRDRVTSPGGTTIAGLQVLEEHGLRAALMAAVEAATRRSIELGNAQK